MRTSNIATLGDGTKIFKTINSSYSSALALQTDLTNFEESSKKVNLKLNASECKVLRVTLKHNHNKVIYLYKLSCETILTSTDCERDLGVLTSPDLTWSKHIDHQCHKANKTLGYVRRSTPDTRHKNRHSPSHTLLVPGSRAVVLWLPNLGTTNHHHNSTDRTTSTTGN